jgi:hypothetical protein
VSDIVGTSTASFCRGEDRPRSVAVPVCGVAAVRAVEGPFGQPEARLFLATLRAGHRGIGGRDQHYRPAHPQATLHQLPLRRADRCVGGFARHRGLGQESRPEVLNGDQLMVVNHTPSPQAGRVRVLPRGLLLNPGSFPLGTLVPGRLGLPARTPPRHAPLGFGQVGGAAFAVPLVAHDLTHDPPCMASDRHSWRWPNAMPAISAIPNRPYLLTAKAVGFPGGL